MNPLTKVKLINELNEREAQLGVQDKVSWHAEYSDSAWVFVGGLPYELTEGDIICVFSQYGEIVNINLVRDKKTGKSKGFCFICYEDQRSTILAVDNFNGIKIKGRTIRVDHVANYRPPKDSEDIDDVTKALREKGCGARTPPPSSLESSKDSEVVVKKHKKEKSKKKKKKKEKREHRKRAKEEQLADSLPPKTRVKVEKEDPGYEQHASARQQTRSSTSGNKPASWPQHEPEFKSEHVRVRSRDGGTDREQTSVRSTRRTSYDESFIMANDTLEGFHEVNLASPTTPDLLGVYESSASEQSTSPTVIYRLHPSAVCSTPIQPSALNVSDLPTQPVYSSPRHLNCSEASGISISVTETIPCSTSGLQGGSSKYGNSRKASNNAEREFLQGATITDSAEGSDDLLGLSTDSLSRLRSPSVLEVREKGYERLKEELAKAQRELKLKDEECERLSKVRDQLGQELEELTASLFEEAHKMVREANVKQATAEKQLKEAQGKIDVLQAEVAALKTLVLSTSPTSPTKELQSGGKTPFKKGHARNKSTSSAMGVSSQDVAMMQPIVKDCKEADLALYNEFRSWKDDPTMDRACPFLDKIYQEDIFPCLTFSKSELASAVLEAVENNTLSIEPVGLQPVRFVKASAVECGGPKKCALSGQSKTCKHRIKLGDSSNYYYISPFCRYRITSVCNFFTYIRYIQKGLVKQQDVDQMFWEVMQLRKEMSLAKLGYYKEEL